MNSKTSEGKPVGKVYESLVYTEYPHIGYKSKVVSLGFFSTWYSAMKNGDNWVAADYIRRYEGWKFKTKEHTVYD